MGNRKRLGMTLDATEDVKKRYVIEDIEHIPPFTGSKNEKTARYILGNILNGKNAKPIIVRHGYLNRG